MAVVEEGTSKTFQLYRLAYSLIFCRTLTEILETATSTLSKSLLARNAILWQFSAEEGALAPGVVSLEDKAIKTRQVSVAADYLGQVFRAGKPQILTVEQLQQPNKHIQIPKDVLAMSVLCVPFKGKQELQGVMEFINKQDAVAVFTEEDIDFTTKAMELVTVAAANMRSVENQARAQLNAITRLTLLYDISQIFNSTLELDKLLPIITEKIRDILDADTCTIWLLNESHDGIRCGKSTGSYAELFSGYAAKLEDDIAGEAIQHGEGLILEDATGEERFAKRLTNLEETPVYTYMSAPLECKGIILGTLEVMNRVIDNPFNEEDHFLLNDLSHQAAISIHNANLLQAERKAKELDALLKISHEITSTLNLDKVLLTIVNQAATLVPYERASIALVESGKVRLSAVSGKMEIDQKTPEMRDLSDVLTWIAGLGKGIYISEFNGQIVTDREETREKFKAYFEKTSMKSFIALPLKDEEGELGVLSFESSAPYFLDERHLEVASILANQATVAIRNAQLYRQVPLMNLMQPFMERKARLMKMPKTRRIAWGVGMAVLLLVMIAVPWNMKVMGDATVLPAKRIPVVSQVEGIVGSVPVREGEQVHKGTPIASLDDRDYRLALEEQQTRRDLLTRGINRSRSLGDSSNARLQQIQLDQVNKEVEFNRYQLNATRLVAPYEGIVITPKIEERVGSLLRKGERFCELADMRTTRADVTVDEGEIGYLKVGQKVRLKMNAFPTMKFYGTIIQMGAEIISHSDPRLYRVEAQIGNPDMLLKSGMVGKAKLEVGYKSIGYVLLRKPFRFIWKKFWTWLP